MYIIPGNPLVTDDKLPYWHEYLAKEDPNISKALGKKAKIERMKAGMLYKYYSPLVRKDIMYTSESANNPYLNILH